MIRKLDSYYEDDTDGIILVSAFDALDLLRHEHAWVVEMVLNVGTLRPRKLNFDQLIGYEYAVHDILAKLKERAT